MAYNKYFTEFKAYSYMSRNYARVKTNILTTLLVRLQPDLCQIKQFSEDFSHWLSESALDLNLNQFLTWISLPVTHFSIIFFDITKEHLEMIKGTWSFIRKHYRYPGQESNPTITLNELDTYFKLLVWEWNDSLKKGLISYISLK